jgi:hypothetical protein
MSSLFVCFEDVIDDARHRAVTKLIDDNIVDINHYLTPPEQRWLSDAQWYGGRKLGTADDLIAIYRDREPHPKASSLLRRRIDAGLRAPSVADVKVMIGRIIDSLTNSPSNPYGPVRRTRDGAYMDSSAGPSLTGTPTERLVHLYLWSQRSTGHDASVKRIAQELGSSLVAVEAAIRTLVRERVVVRMHQPGIGFIARLADVHTPRQADRREERHRMADVDLMVGE